MARRLLIAAGEAASHPEQLPFGVRELIDAAEGDLGGDADAAQPL